MKRILIISLSGDEYFGLGGQEKITFGLINIINELNYKYQWLIPEKNKINKKHYNVIAVNKFNISFILKTIKNFNPDIIFSFDPISNFYCFLYKSFNKQTKLIYYFEDNHYFFNKFYYFLDKIFLSKFEKIIVPNKYWAEKLFKNEKTVIINNFIDDSFFIENNSSQSKEYFLYAGKLEFKKKQVDFIIDAFIDFLKTNPDEKLLLIGEGRDKNNIIQIIKKHNLEERIILKPYQENILPFLSKAKAVIIASKYEMQPLIILEALVLNVPILCLYLPELAELKKYRIIFYNNKKELTELLKSKSEAIVDKKTNFAEFSFSIYQKKITKVLSRI